MMPWDAGKAAALAESVATALTARGPTEGPTFLVKQLWLDNPDIDFVALIRHPSLKAHAADLARWHRVFQNGMRDLERVARRRNPRLMKLAPPGDIELPFDRWTLAREAAVMADRFEVIYRDLVDSGHLCNKEYSGRLPDVCY